MNLNYDDAPKRAQDFLREKMEKREQRSASSTDARKLDTGYTSDRPVPGGDYTTVSSSSFMPEGLSYEGDGYAKASDDIFRDQTDKDFGNRTAQNAMDLAQKNVNADAGFKGLRQNVSDMSDYYRQSSRRRTLGLFGDVWNVQGSPEWKSPDAPKEITANIPETEDINKLFKK